MTDQATGKGGGKSGQLSIRHKVHSSESVGMVFREILERLFSPVSTAHRVELQAMKHRSASEERS